MTVAQIRKKIIPILKHHKVSKASIFGSFARGDAKPKSDLDLLVNLGGNKSLLDLVALKLELESTIDMNVDLLTYRSLHPLLRKSVFKKLVKII